MRDPDAVISDLAVRQHGVVARRQLIRAGVAHHLVDLRVARRRLRPVHRGIYVVGPVEAPRAREMAAVLACGPATVVSHTTAAALWGQVRAGGAPTARPHVITPRGDHRRPGIRAHRIATLASDETTRLDRIPVTTPARTLLDLAGMATPRELERALAETFARRLAPAAAIRKVVERHAGSPGAGLLRALLDGPGPARTRSEAEERLMAMIARAGLPAARVNSRIEGLEVDFVWPDHRLVVEVDGHASHGSRAAVERDRRRDARLHAAGYRVLRFTWSQLDDEPLATIATLSRILGSGAGASPTRRRAPAKSARSEAQAEAASR